MSWYIYSILTSVCFTGMILLVRLLGNKGFSSRQTLLFLIGFVFFGFLVMNIGTFNEILRSDNFLAFIIIISIAGIFSVIGNIADFEAIKRAPNPGFPLAIRNSNIVLVALVSVLLFGSPFNIFKSAGVILVLFGIIMLVLEKNKSFDNNLMVYSGHWRVLTFIAFVSFTIMVFSVKKATILGFSSQAINFLIFGFNLVILSFVARKEFILCCRSGQNLKFFLPVVFSAAAFSFIGNFLSVKGLALSPNPGYHEAIKNTNLLFVTLLAIPLFSVKLDRKKILGAFTILAGIVIIVI